MYITQHNVFDALDGIEYRAFIKGDTVFKFQQNYLLSEGEHFSDAEKLYVCSFRVLPETKCENPENVCILCVGDEDEIADYAEENSLNIIAVSPKVSVIKVFNLLYQAFNDLLRWSYQVNSRIAAQEDFQNIIAVSREVFGDNPLLLVNASYNVMAVSSMYSGDNERVRQVLEMGYFPKEYMDKIADIGYHRNSYRYTTPMSYESNFMGCPFLMTTFYDNRAYYGFMVLYFPDGKVPTRGQLGLFTWLAKKIRSYFLRSIGTGKSVPSQKETFISDLLMHTREDEEYLADRANSLKIPMDMKYRICVIQWQNYSRPQTEYVLWRLKNDLELSSYRVLIYQNMLILLMNGDLASMSIQEKVQYTSRTISSLLETGGGYAGFSMPDFPLLKINVAFQQALSAARLGRQFEPENKLYFYSKYYIYEMLSDYSKRYSLDNVCLWSLSRLRGEEGEDNNDYKLLRIFLLTERNISLTARLMHMHRNSVIYRLKRIQEILLVDLDDPETRLRLLISFKIMEMKDGSIAGFSPEELELSSGDPLFME